MVDGGQGEYVRVPLADGTLVSTREVPDESMVPSLLSLSDVMGTGWHAAVAARVAEGDTVVVVGDGAVGLSAVLAAERLGAERIIAMSRHEPRQRVARDFGATDVVEARGEDAVAAVQEMTDGVGRRRGARVRRHQRVHAAPPSPPPGPGATVGYVGVPHGIEYPVRDLFARNVGIAGGIAPARQYLPQLRDDVLSGAINPGAVFDLELPLDRRRRGVCRHGRAPRDQVAAAPLSRARSQRPAPSQTHFAVETDEHGGTTVLIDGYPQSYVSLDDPGLLVFGYVQLLGALLDALPAGPLAVTHVGGAAMTLPRYVAHTRPGSPQIVLEPDAALTEHVREVLPLPRGHRIRVRPTAGRAGVAALGDASADAIVVDAFADNQVPPTSWAPSGSPTALGCCGPAGS